MLKFPGPVVLQLRDGELLAVGGVRLAVERGRVWVTQTGDPEDHVLGGGESMQIVAGARALVSAEGPAQLALAARPAGRGSVLARWSRRLAGLTARRLPCDLDFSLAK